MKKEKDWGSGLVYPGPSARNWKFLTEFRQIIIVIKEREREKRKEKKESVCCGGQVGNFWVCPVPTTETPTGFGASGANNKCLWFFVFFFYCYRRQGPIPQNQYVINYNTRHPPALLTVYFLTPPPAPPGPKWFRGRPPDVIGRPLLRSESSWLWTQREREKEREHLLLPPFTSIWNGWLERNLSCFFPTPPLSLHFPSLSLSPLGFEGLGNSFLVFGKNNNNKIWRVR